MKKILICISICLLLCTTAFAEQPNSQTEEPQYEIAGLREKMDNLWLVNHFTQEELDDIFQQVVDRYVENFWSVPWEQRKQVEWRHIPPDMDADTYLAGLLANIEPEFENHLLLTRMNVFSMLYLNQYIQSGNFKYLLSDEAFFAPIRVTQDGEVMHSNSPRGSSSQIKLGDEEFAFIRDVNNIAKMLYEAGEDHVKDVKFLNDDTGSFQLLYFDCGENEYFIRLIDSPTEKDKLLIPEFQRFKLYPIEEVGRMCVDFYEYLREQNGWLMYISEMERIVMEKPDYSKEAESLQQEGILLGNEKGLDLLKPLTRIEAVTILVRVLGYENESVSTVSIFSDIPDDNWGVKYANIASEKGISIGVGDNKFAPDELVTDNQFATMLLRSTGDTEFNWEKAGDLLTENGIAYRNEGLRRLNIRDDLFTRGDLAKIIYEAKKMGMIQ